MVRRLPAPPPALAGYTLVRSLGSGTIADVYLYEQDLLRRFVAVKVLLPAADQRRVLERFLDQAAELAQLCTHPAVLTVYEAGVSADGRPYLVTEYCPAGHADAYRSAPLPVEEVLRVGISVGGALESAHRAGLVHRDVRPANILTTRYGYPVLADYGLATIAFDADAQELSASALPWTAPEVLLGATAGDIPSDVWGLAATLYTLLRGLAPFDVAGVRLDRNATIERVTSRDQPGPLGRTDVPTNLERHLLAALSKDPAKRPQSMLEFVHLLRVAEQQVGLRRSAFDVEEQAATGLEAVAGSGGDTAESVAESIRRSATPAVPRRPVRVTVLGGALSAAVLGGIALVGLTWSSLPRVDAIRSHDDASSVTFTWDDPGGGSGDQYLIHVDGVERAPQQQRHIVIERDARDSPTCITVTVLRGADRGEPSDPVCAPE